MIKHLDQIERNEIGGVFDEFGCEIPPETQANVIAEIEDDELIACMTAEHLIRTDMWWVAPEHRRSVKGARAIKRLIDHLFSVIPKDFSVIVLADTKRKESLLTRLGFREVEGKVFRLDR